MTSKQEIFRKFFSINDTTSNFIHKGPGEINSNDITLKNVCDSKVRILDVTDRIIGDSLSSSNLLLGPCKNSVVLRNCDYCTISTICKELRLSNCSDIELFVFCSTPIVLEDCSNITIKKVNFGYSGLTSHLITAGLQPAKDYTIQVKDISDLDENSESSTYTILSDEKDIETVLEIIEIEGAQGDPENPFLELSQFSKGNDNPKPPPEVDYDKLDPELADFLYPDRAKKDNFDKSFQAWKKEKIAVKRKSVEEGLKKLEQQASSEVEEFYAERAHTLSNRMSENRKEEERKQKETSQEPEAGTDDLWQSVLELMKECSEYEEDYKVKKTMFDLVIEKAQG